MMSLSTLINAAALKGYLHASGAVPEAIGWAEQIIAAEMARAGEAHVRNEDVRLPNAAQPIHIQPAMEPSLTEMIVNKSKVAQPSDDARVESELAERQGEDVPEIQDSPTGTETEDVSPTKTGKCRWTEEQKAVLLEMRGRHPAATWKEVAEAVGKPASSCQQMGFQLKKFPERKPLSNSYRIKQAAIASSSDEPKMLFRTVKGKNKWGRPCEVQQPVPTGDYIDKDTGAKVTTYPAGYAIGTGPQRNVFVRGGS